MMEHDQVNVRVPDKYKELVRQVARALRDDPSSPPRIQKAINGLHSPALVLELMQRIERIESAIGGFASFARDMAPIEEEHPEQSVGVEFAFSRGEGMSRRMTSYGKHEAIRLSKLGTTTTQIAAVVGVTQQAVDQFLRRHRASLEAS